MQFAEIYRGIDNRYGLFLGFGNTNPKTGKKDKVCKMEHGSPPYIAHIEGNTKIGIYPFTENKKVAWGCIDIDDYISLDIPKVAKQVAELGLPGVVTRSTNGGAHVWFHFTQSVSAKQLRNKLRDIRDVMGLDPKTELFPKQDEIDLNGNVGNFVFIPYNGGARGGSYAVNDKTGEAIQTIEEFEKYVATKKLNSVNDIKVIKKSLVPDHDEPGEIIEYQDQDLELKDFIDEAPPCLKTILNIKGGFAEEGRNNALYGYAVLSKKAKGKATHANLTEANNTFQSPLKDDELKTIIKSVNSKEYHYKCKDIPLETYCSKEACKMMKYGIGTGIKETSYFDNFVFVNAGPKVVQLKPVLKEIELAEAKAIMNKDLGRIDRGKTKTLAGDVWHLELAKRNSVDVIKWHPGKPRTYEEPGDSGNVVKCINTYRPTTRIPVAGDLKPYLDFFKTRIENQEVNKYYHDRIAFLIQHPGKRCPVILLFVSDEGGTGKSIIDMIMTELVGVHNISNIDVKSFLSGWGDYFKKKLWVIVEEMYSQGSEKTNLNAALKRYSSMKWASNNGKFQKIGDVDQMFCNFYLTTNKGTAMTVEEGDRRPLIYNFDNDKKAMRTHNTKEGQALYKWCEEEEGYEKILNFYKTRDIREFDPFAWPPETEAKRNMMLKTVGFKFKGLYEAWLDSRWPFFKGVDVYCPFHLADLVNMDREQCLELMKTHMGIEFCTRAQNIQWARRFLNGGTYDYSHTMEDINLWTTNKNLVDAKGKGIKPGEITYQYLHPVKDNRFGDHFVQDKKHKEPIMETRLKEGHGENYQADKDNENVPF